VGKGEKPASGGVRRPSREVVGGLTLRAATLTTARRPATARMVSGVRRGREERGGAGAAYVLDERRA